MKNYWKFCCLTIFIVLIAHLFVPNAAAQQAKNGKVLVPDVEYGQTKTGEIVRRNEVDKYIFDSSMGDIVFIIFRADFQPRIELLDSNSALLAASESGELELNISEAGQVTLTISDDNFKDVGDYELTLQKRNPPVNSEEIEIGEVLTGVLSTLTEVQSYALNIDSSMQLEIMLDDIVSGMGTFNPNVGLYNSTGVEIVSSTAATIPVSLEVAGVYYLMIWDLGSDGTGNYDLQLNKVITPLNHPPVAESQSVSLNQDTSLDIVLTATDADGDVLTYTIVSQPVNGVLTGTVPNVTYTPNAGYVGSDSFTFIANDGELDSNVGTISITMENGSQYSFDTTEEFKLTSGDPIHFHGFGISADIDGDYAIVGAHQDSSLTGSAYIFKYTDDTWIEQQKLLASDGATGDSFGGTVSISGEYAILGAPGDDYSGSAYIFRRDGEEWIECQKLVPHDPQSDESFGSKVSIDGNVAVVSAPWKDGTAVNTGAVYIFRLDGEVWNEEAKIVSDDAEYQDTFGRSLMNKDDLLIATSMDNNSAGTGSAYIFRYNGETWVQEARLVGVDVQPGDWYGISSSIDGDTAVVGAYEPWIGPGAAYVFVRQDGTWVQQAKLTADDGSVGDHFGSNVTVFGDVAFIGSDLDDDYGTSSGSFYYFKREGGEWTQQRKFLASDGASGDSFGYPVATDGASVIAGARSDTIDGISAGSAYIFMAEEAASLENQSPVAEDQSVIVTQDSFVDIILLATDEDGDVLSYSIVDGPSNGTLSGIAPEVTYTPNPGYVVEDSFTFIANDGELDSNVGTVGITVESVSQTNQAPQLDPVGDKQVEEGQLLNFTVTASDADGDILELSGSGLPVGASFDAGTGEFDWTPGFDQAGSYEVTFTVSDGSLTDSETITVTVINVNRAPVAEGQDVSVDQDTSVGIILTATDADGDALMYSIVSQPVNGVLTGTAPNVTYTPNTGYVGSGSFTFMANDGEFDSNVGTVNISVIQKANSAPVAEDQNVNVSANTAKDIDLVATDTDGDALTYSIVTQPANGVLTGTAPDVTYTPNAGYVGSDSFTFIANDGALDSNLGTVDIIIYSSAFLIEGGYLADENFYQQTKTYGNLDSPKKVLVDSQNNVFVKDLSGILKFDSDGAVIDRDFYVDYVTHMGIDSSDAIYVLSHYYKDPSCTYSVGFPCERKSYVKVWQLSPTGAPLSLIIDMSDSSTGMCERYCPYPTTTCLSYTCTAPAIDNYTVESMVVTYDQFFYIYFSELSYMEKFDLNGESVARWGGDGSADGQFSEPEGMALDSEGYIYVADTNNHRIQKFDSDGNFILKWGAYGSNQGEFNFPRGIAADDAGFIYVADTENYRIQKFDSQGNFITSWGRYGTRLGEFDFPRGIAVDQQNCIYVADTRNNLLQKFCPVEDNGQNDAPQFYTIEEKTVAANEDLTFEVLAVDSDPGDQVVSYSTGPLPEGAQFDVETLTFSWAPAFEQVGEYTVVFQAADMQGLTGEVAVDITVFPYMDVELTSPEQDSWITVSDVNFSWRTGLETTQFALGVGTTAESVESFGSGDLYFEEFNGLYETTVSGIPFTGVIYVRLWAFYEGVWIWKDYSFQTSEKIKLSGTGRFGLSIDSTEEFVVIGAPADSENKIHIYQWQNGELIQTDAWQPWLNQEISVSLDEYTLLASGEETSFIYEYIDEEWVLLQELVPADVGSNYGRFVSLKGDLAVIGNFDEGAHIYRKTDGAWLLEASVTEGTNYAPVHTDGNRVIVGNYYDEQAHIYHYSDQGWSIEAAVSPVPPAEYSSGTYSAFITDTMAFLGYASYSNDEIYSYSSRHGAVVFYEFNGVSWQQSQIIIPEEPLSDGHFGVSIDMYDGRLIVGSDSEWTQGEVYIFEQRDGRWEQIRMIAPTDPAVESTFGNAVSANSQHLIIGSPGNDAVYLYDW